MAKLSPKPRKRTTGELSFAQQLAVNFIRLVAAIINLLANARDILEWLSNNDGNFFS